ADFGVRGFAARCLRERVDAVPDRERRTAGGMRRPSNTRRRAENRGEDQRSHHEQTSRARTDHFPSPAGTRNAMNSPEYGPPLTATTMYCLPFTAYVIGDALTGAGSSTSPTCAPDFLS